MSDKENDPQDGQTLTREEQLQAWRHKRRLSGLKVHENTPKTVTPRVSLQFEKFSTVSSNKTKSLLLTPQTQQRNTHFITPGNPQAKSRDRDLGVLAKSLSSTFDAVKGANHKSALSKKAQRVEVEITEQSQQTFTSRETLLKEFREKRAKSAFQSSARPPASKTPSNVLRERPPRSESPFESCPSLNISELLSPETRVRQSVVATQYAHDLMEIMASNIDAVSNGTSSVEEVREWMVSIQDDHRYKAQYWIMRSILEENEGNYDEAVKLYETADHFGAQPMRELQNCFSELLSRLKLKSGAQRGDLSPIPEADEEFLFKEPETSATLPFTLETISEEAQTSSGSLDSSNSSGELINTRRHNSKSKSKTSPNGDTALDVPGSARPSRRRRRSNSNNLSPSELNRSLLDDFNSMKIISPYRPVASATKITTPKSKHHKISQSSPRSPSSSSTTSDPRNFLTPPNRPGRRVPVSTGLKGPPQRVFSKEFIRVLHGSLQKFQVGRSPSRKSPPTKVAETVDPVENFEADMFEKAEQEYEDVDAAKKAQMKKRKRKSCEPTTQLGRFDTLVIPRKKRNSVVTTMLHPTREEDECISTTPKSHKKSKKVRRSLFTPGQPPLDIQEADDEANTTHVAVTSVRRSCRLVKSPMHIPSETKNVCVGFTPNPSLNFVINDSNQLVQYLNSCGVIDDDVPM